MPDVSKLRLDDVTYNIKDDNARKYLVMVNEEPVSATKVVIETGEEDEIELALQEDVDKNATALTLMCSDIVTIKEMGETIEGYTYGAFCTGCVFAGKELYAFRAAKQHETVAGEYGEILFYQRKYGNKFERINISTTYDANTYGELRDPNLCVSRDGTRLYLSCFCDPDNSGTGYTSVLIAFDTSLTQIGISYIPDAIFWGNTLETPSGHLIHTDYSGFSLALYRTNEVVSSSNISSLTWQKLTPFVLNSGYAYAESTLGYFNDRLVMFTRTGAGHASEVSYTFDSEGLTNWTQSKSIFYIFHAPCLLPYCTGHLLPFSGSVQNANITGHPNKRLPYVGLISFNNTQNTNAAIGIEAGGLVVGVDEFTTYGGYTSLVKLDDYRYGIMYYEDGPNNGNAVRFTEVNLNRSRLNMSYQSLEDHNTPVVLFTNDAKSAYENKFLAWVVAALGINGYAVLDFACSASSSGLVNMPSGIPSNFSGRAWKNDSQYFCEVIYAVGTAMRRYRITGTATSILTATWTELQMYSDLNVTISGNTGTAQYIALPYKAGYVISHLCVISASTSIAFLLMPPMNVTNDAYTRAYKIANGDNVVTLRVYYEPAT